MTFLYLNSDRIGKGEPELGAAILVKFLDELAKSDVSVDLVGLAHAAVLLSTRPGPALDALRALVARGARIANCGTCVDHFGLRDAILVGEIGTMAMMVQFLGTADRVLQPC
jgi:hypothetical protein